MFLRNMKIASRAGISFAILTLLVVLVGGFSLLQMKRMNGAAAEVKEVWLPAIAALNDMGQNILRIRTATLRLIVIREPSALAQNTALLNQLKGDLRQAQARYESLISLDTERQL